jgi:hypothetical protein
VRVISEVVKVDKVVPAKINRAMIGQCGRPPKYLNASEELRGILERSATELEYCSLELH